MYMTLLRTHSLWEKMGINHDSFIVYTTGGAFLITVNRLVCYLHIATNRYALTCGLDSKHVY